MSGWWFGTFFIFHFIYGRIIPTDELIFFRGVGRPPTRYGYGSKPIHTIFRGMNIHKSQLF
jgi:hypothetical protein